MEQLRDHMEQVMVLRKLSAATRRNYLRYCSKFAGHYGRSPEELEGCTPHRLRHSFAPYWLECGTERHRDAWLNCKWGGKFGQNRGDPRASAK